MHPTHHSQSSGSADSPPSIRRQTHPPSPQASFGSDGDIDFDVDYSADVEYNKDDVNMDESTPSLSARRKGKSKAIGTNPRPPPSQPITHAQNGLMSPPTPAPSPTPGRNGWWGTVPRGPAMGLGMGMEVVGGEERAGEAERMASHLGFDPQHLLEAFPSLPPPTRLALINGLLPMLTTPELLMLSSHIGPRLKRDFLRDLPNELALHVLKFVDDPRTLARASCVSRHWRKLLEDEQTWKEMCERHRLHPSQALPAVPSLPRSFRMAGPPPPMASGLTSTPETIDPPTDVTMVDAAESSSSSRNVIPSSTNGVAPAFGITGPEMFVASRVRRDSGLMETETDIGPAHGYPVIMGGNGIGNPAPPAPTSTAPMPVVSAPNQPAAYILHQHQPHHHGQPPHQAHGQQTPQAQAQQPPEGQINGQLPPLPSVVAPAAAALSTVRRTGMINTTPRGVVASQSEPMKMTNVRGDAFGLGNIGKKMKEDGFSYKTAFKKAYLTESNWLRGGRLLSSHTSADDGVVTSLAVDSNYIIIGMANSKIHVFTASGGVFVRTLVGHSLGVWCLTLISEGGGVQEPVEEEMLGDSSDEEVLGGGLFDPKVLKAFKTDKKGFTPSRTNLPSATAAKSRKRARPANHQSSDDFVDDGASIGLGAFNASRPINFNFGAGPSKYASGGREETEPETPPEDSGAPNRAKRMEQSDVCGAARGWGQKNTLVVSGGCDRDVRVWDLKTGFCRHVLRGHTSTIRCVKAIDGRPIVVSGSRDATLRVWDIEKGLLLHSLVGHQHSVRCIEVAGNQVVSGSYDCTCRIWDVDTGECLQVLRGHYHQIYAVAFDGERVATGSLDSTVRIWSAATGDCVALLQGHTSLVGQLQLSGDTLVTGGSDGRVIIFDLVNYTCLQRICAHDNSVTCLQFDERFIVSGGNDGRIKLWDIKTGNFIRELSKPCEAVWRVTFRDDKCAILCKRGGKTVLEVLSFVPDDAEIMNGTRITEA